MDSSRRVEQIDRQHPSGDFRDLEVSRGIRGDIVGEVYDRREISVRKNY